MRIVFVRHGEPDYEHDCLTEEGRVQAALCAERLREEGIQEIFSSPQGRAAETAEAAAKVLALPVKTLDFMRELQWGSLNGSPITANGHPWELADRMAQEGWDLTDPGWRDHEYFRNNKVTAAADHVAENTDQWLRTLGYERKGFYYLCRQEDDRQKTVALFSHGGSSAAAMSHILNMTFPYACGLFHLEFTGITIIRLDRKPGSLLLPCLELANDGRHIHGVK